MIITFSESKVKLRISGKVLITSLSLKAKTRPKKYKKVRYANGSFINKDLSKIIREFDKLPYKSYERRRPKHEPTNSYFYLARQLANCIIRDDVLNSHIYPVRTEMTATKQIPTLHVFSTDEIELKYFLVDENLLQIYSTDKVRSKGIIVDKRYTEKDKS